MNRLRFSTTHTTFSIFVSALLLTFSFYAASTSTNASSQSTAHPSLSAIADVSVILIPTEDTYVNSSRPNTNYSNELNLLVSEQSSTQTETNALLKFDLSNIPANSIIQSAELHLYQIRASGADFSISASQVTEDWQADSVIWDTKPATLCCINTVIASDSADQIIVWDLKSLVESWLYNSANTPNYGIELRGESSLSHSRFYSSMEGKVQPELIINYTPPPTEIAIPLDAETVRMDGLCDRTEYGNAIQQQYLDAAGTIGTIYLKHDNDNLYLCAQGAFGFNQNRFFSLYLDTDQAMEVIAETDDYALRIAVETDTLSTLAGTGVADGYTAVPNPPTWSGVADTDGPNGGNERAEYQIPLDSFFSICGNPFGLALYHQQVSQNDNYGWPTNQAFDQPVTWVRATLDSQSCTAPTDTPSNTPTNQPITPTATLMPTHTATLTPTTTLTPAVNTATHTPTHTPTLTATDTPTRLPIVATETTSATEVATATPTSTSSNVPAATPTPRLRVQVCVQTENGCTPSENATVYRHSAGATQSETFDVDADGYLLDNGQIDFGDALFALEPMIEEARYTVYRTNGVSAVVGQSTPGLDNVLTLAVDERTPLMLHDLIVSTQWDLESDPAFKAELEANLHKTSAYLYDFTDGQMALGTVTIYQNYEQWENADIWLHANNYLRPKAVAGGVLTEPKNDPLLPNISYQPGQIYMGSAWNRYNVPPGESIPANVDTSNDWPLTAAHELGHYALFLFDTYFKLGEDDKIIQTDSCTGSAMGWVYDEENTEFISNQSHWDENCTETIANQKLNRTEWETIQLWYPWVVPPTAADSGPDKLPAELTTVTFITPSQAANPLLNQNFDLNYQENEASSKQARAVLFRDDRIIDQGRPIKGTTQIELKGAQSGDRFCVYDINDYAELPETARNQYGCESLTVGDNALQMEKDASWSPVINITPLTSQTFAISVTQAIDDTVLKARLYPEHRTGGAEIILESKGSLHQGTFILEEFTPSAYVELWAEETATEANPARAALVDFGIFGAFFPGPAVWHEYAPIISSDGRALVIPVQPVSLKAGEFIAIQSMAGTPRLPSGATTVGQPYRLISLPPSLVTSGVVSLQFPELAQQGQAQGRSGSAEAMAMYFWDGASWKRLETIFTDEPDGSTLASAPSQGVGAYLLMSGDLQIGGNSLYLPLVQK